MLLVVFNWVAVGLLAIALVIAALAWAGRIRFRGAQARRGGRAFTVLDLGALLQAGSQLPDGAAARWTLSSLGVLFVVLGAVLVLRLRRAPVAG